MKMLEMIEQYQLNDGSSFYESRAAWSDEYIEAINCMSDAAQNKLCEAVSHIIIASEEKCYRQGLRDGLKLAKEIQEIQES